MDGDSPEVCVMNLGPGGRRLRWIIAAAMAVVTAVLLLAIHLTDAPRAWRLLALAPLLAGSLGVYQAVGGISDLITVPGLINLDFADVRTIMTRMGRAVMGTGVALRPERYSGEQPPLQQARPSTAAAQQQSRPDRLLVLRRPRLGSLGAR